MTETLMRSITILVIISFIGSILYFGNNLSYLFTIFLISTYAFYEWNTLTSKPIYNLFLFSIITFLLYFSSIVDVKFLSFSTLIVWLGLISAMFFFTSTSKHLFKKYSNILGFFIVTTFFLHLINFYPQSHTFSNDPNLPDGKYYIAFLIVLLSSIDIFSYFSGKFFGSFKVFPNISPNKTIEGYIGGFTSTIILFFVFSHVFDITWVPVDILFLTFIILLSFCGDLFISFIKRIYEIKDTGNLLPGHGGILDRLDSYLPSIPLFFIWLMI